MPALLLLLLLPCLAFAQPDTTWSRSFVLGDRTYLYDAVVVDDTLIVTCGYSQVGISSADQDYLLAAYTTSGDSVYVRNYLQTASDEALEGIIHLSGDTVVTCGWSTNGEALNVLAFSAQSGDLLWERVYNPGDGLCKGRGLTKLDDGRFAAVGYRLPPGGTRSDGWVILCEANGDSVWGRTFGGEGTEIGNSILQLDNGMLRVAGITRESSFTDYDQWGILVDLNGVQVGSDVVFGTETNDYCYNTEYDVNGATWLIGRAGENNTGYGYVNVIPETGNSQTLTFSTPGFSDQFRAGLSWFGGIMFAGRSGENSGVTSQFLRAINDENQTTWSWRFGAAALDAGFNNIVQLPNGGAVAVGADALAQDTTVIRGYLLSISPPAGIRGVVTGLTSGEPVNGAVVRAVGDQRFTLTDEQGAYRLDLAPGTHDITVSGGCIESDTTFSVSVIENDLTEVNFTPGEPLYGMRPSSINIIAENHLTATGEVMFENAGSGSMSYSVEIETITPHGAWMTVSPENGVLAPGEETVIEVTVNPDTTDDGSFEFLGQLTIRSNACPDSALTLPVIVSVLDADERAAIPGAFELSPAYPNPFNNSTRLTLSLPTETEVTLELYNTNGQLAATLFSRRMAAGSHNVSIDLAGYASGFYLARAKTPEAFAVQKLLLLR